MELILKSDDKNSIAKIIDLAKSLNVVIEQFNQGAVANDDKDIEAIRKRLLNFKAEEPSSIKDPVKWQREQRQDNNLPFLR